MAQPRSTTRPSIVFFGSGPLALESLRAMSQEFSVEAVITKPRPEHHRGPVPVLEYCARHSLPHYTPRTKGELTALFTSVKFDSSVGVVIDYGIIIAKEVIEYFPFGIVNSHFSLLPEWRGADPITFAILSGQDQTGVSLMLIDEKMDEGPLLAQSAISLSSDITTPRLTEQLIELSNAMLVEILPAYLAGEIDPAPQNNTIAASDTPSYSRKLTKADSIIDWSKPATELEREIRAFTEWPKSKTILAGKEIVITKAHVVLGDGKAGSYLVENKQLIMYCGTDALSIDTLKPSGKATMPIDAFLAGYGSLL